ncbi:UDP-N-acetylmuramoylalanine/D-glutamate ligase [Tolumonas auensis DSM 9187]|uniref:UDP-N-acetylmuramoylalanine--D-glutamate ligase n=1 Tax=Tolumonas auensis (strain DSM 9187 / NBRC 110442 / TA 4) TaxID=595494 RepID=C4LA23_TOLAT|nr:UDP-N-acetylmuramoyl-L-alanine--D-glutamate ligase [Tolumonas auensis]ACQ92152.1 UDP-N-acetylmuramoylalanine/D-glutamate ligase [Tolumonas auensis DSM 9187]
MKQVVIIGLGKTGLSCVTYFRQRGITPLVMDTRENPPGKESLPADCRLITGPLDAEVLCSASLIVASPGIALATPALQAAQMAGVEIVGDIELFAREAKAPVVAITGSNGKSTVTTLVGLMAEQAGFKVGIGGNIGTPALDLLLQPADLYVLELSSFQLETTSSLQPAAAVILNLSEDHLDRYDGMAGYLAAKQRIFANAKHIVVNRDDAATLPPQHAYWQSFGLNSESYGRVQQDDGLWLSVDGKPVLSVAELNIVGAHNQMNALAAMALADAVGIPQAAQLTVLRSFTGLSHRCQFVRDVNGVRWINDSKATNVGSTLAAVAGVGESVQGRLWLLAGGQGKGQDFSPLQPLLANQIYRMVCFGQDAGILMELADNTQRVADLDEAVRSVAAEVQPGDWVLLAPACASLDQFRNFEQRGQRFADLVNAL